MYNQCLIIIYKSSENLIVMIKYVRCSFSYGSCGQHGSFQACREKRENNSALLWQKEASDVPSKSELLMFSY